MDMTEKPKSVTLEERDGNFKELQEKIKSLDAKQTYMFYACLSGFVVGQAIYMDNAPAMIAIAQAFNEAERWKQ